MNKCSYTRVIDSPSYSSPILISGESAWITNIGRCRMWVKARSCKNKTLNIIEKCNNTHRDAYIYTCARTYEKLTSSCPPQAAVCSMSLQYFSNSSGRGEISVVSTVIQTHIVQRVRPQSNMRNTMA